MLHAGLRMGGRRFLPPSASDLLDLLDRAIARARPRPPARHGGWRGWQNHDLRIPCARGFVEGDRGVRRVRRDAGDVADHSLDQIGASRGVIDIRVGQGVGDDHTRPVDAELSRLPASPSPASMFHRGPFSFAHDRESGAVDDERRARARRSATNRGGEMLTTP